MFPSYLGYRFWFYKNVFLKKNYFHYSSENKLLEIVNNSIKKVPYYTNRYAGTIDSLADFEKHLSFIDKDEVMNHWKDFQNLETCSSKIIKGTTGGTSGKPLNLVIPKDRYVFELGTMYKMWEQFGWKGHTRAVIRNIKLKNEDTFKVDPLKKEIIFDGFRTSDEYYYRIYSILKKFNIGFIHAYPSSAYQFSLFLRNKKLDVSFIRAFFCGSEGILPEQKQLIQNELGIRLFHWYGHSEKLILGGYCSHNDLIHIEPTYGYFELIDEKGRIINEPGKIGEIVGSTFHNPYMPLIRYRTGDYAEYAGNYCKDCGRNLPLLKKVFGRWDKNKIYRSDNSYITSTALNLHSDIYNKINGLQYLQKRKGELEVRIIKGESFTNATYLELEKHYKDAFGHDNHIQIEFVTRLEKQANGKFLNLISTVKK